MGDTLDNITASLPKLEDFMSAESAALVRERAGEMSHSIGTAATAAGHVLTVVASDAAKKAGPSLEALHAVLSAYWCATLELFRRLLLPAAKAAAEAIDAQLGGLPPWQVAAGSMALAICVMLTLQGILAWSRRIARRGIAPLVFETLRSLPGVRGMVAKEQAKIMDKVRKELAKSDDPSDPAFLSLPRAQLPYESVLARCHAKLKRDKPLLADGLSTISGTVYMEDGHRAFLNDVYSLFSHTNPIHADAFPSVRRMEAEVVSMTASMLGGGQGGLDTVCGAMTSGGTESIISAVKAARDYSLAVRGITEPEMIVADSAHAAFVKAAEYYKIKLVTLRVGKDFRLTASSVSRRVTRNTILLVASAPGYPHGVVDDVEGLAALALQRRCLLHVDCCLGGFVLPFARRLGFEVPPFDFSVPGVTSMSVDTHKFGMAHKGTSVVLYARPDLRKAQYTAITDWTGGLYISPGIPGSRSGGLISTAWASMVSMGWEGYCAATKDMMLAAAEVRSGIEGISGLAVCGEPVMTVVAFTSTDKKIDIFKVNDLMTRRGWELNALQRPPALHICLTVSHVRMAGRLVSDLRVAVEQLRADPGCIEGGMAPVYGMASKLPDRGALGDILTIVQDANLSV